MVVLYWTEQSRKASPTVLELAAHYPKIAVAYTQIATIATDDHHTLQEFRASTGAGRTVQKDLDIKEYTDPEHDPMIPHTFVLKPGLVIHSIYNGYWFWGRPSFYDLWHDLCAATAEIRPRGSPRAGRSHGAGVTRGRSHCDPERCRLGRPWAGWRGAR